MGRQLRAVDDDMTAMRFPDSTIRETVRNREHCQDKRDRLCSTPSLLQGM